MKVLKFGGTSVGNTERLRSIIQLIPHDDRIIIVLSAMSGTTSKLYELISLFETQQQQEAEELVQAMTNDYLFTASDLLGNHPLRQSLVNGILDIFDNLKCYLNGVVLTQEQKNIIVAAGEFLSTQIFTSYLHSIQVHTELLYSTEFIRIDSNQIPDKLYLREKLHELINRKQDCRIFVTQGFICTNHHGTIDNLGRGGSDYSASLIAHAIDACELQIWSDIDGMHNNDPRYIEHTRPIRMLSFDEAAELAYFGAKILHPASIQPCKEKQIPVYLKNTLQPEDKGTLISTQYKPAGIKAVAAKDGITAIKIKSSGMLMAYGFLKKVFDIFFLFEK